VVLIAYRRGLRLVLPSPRGVLVLYRSTASLAVWVVLGQVVYRADTIILSIIPLDRSLNLTNEEAVGIYTAAYKFFDLSYTLPGYMIMTLLPILASLAADRPAFDRYFGRWLPRMSLLGLAVAIFMAILGGPVLLVLSGSSFAPSAPIVVVLSGAIGLSFVTAVLFSAIVALERRQSLVVLYLAIAVGNVAANVALDRWWGYWGAAWLTTISQGITLLGMVWILRDVLGRKR
jgi:O-antigen/teichoic acid export membrane protein